MERPTQRHEALRQRVSAGRERQSAKLRRSAGVRKGGRRIIAIGAGLAMVAGVLTVTQLASSAIEDGDSGLGADGCEETTVTIEEVDADEDLELHTVEEDGVRHYHYRPRDPDPGPEPTESAVPLPPECEEGGSGGEDPTTDPTTDPSSAPGTPDPSDPGTPNDPSPGTVPPGGADGNNNGLELLGRDCSGSDLPLHEGFQSEAAVCVNTQMGEQSALENNPSLLITDFPEWVASDEPFSVTVSTRNLQRNRFLGAAAGGYYIESSFLNDEGITQGHFHFACTPLVDGNVAPDPIALTNPGFFAAVEDGEGGAGVSEVTIDVPGLAAPGMYRCMAWAGSGTHTVPMMTFARQQIAVDTFRLSVTEDGAPPEGEEG